MGMGYSMSEEIKYDPTTGKLLNNDTWVCFIRIKIFVNVILDNMNMMSFEPRHLIT